MAAESKHSARATLVVGILTAASGLLGYAIAGWQQSSQQNKTLTSQTREADKQELRGVVDEAGSALLRTSQALVFKTPPLGSGPHDDCYSASACTKAIAAERKKIKDGERYLATMERAQARLTIRLGRRHPVTRAYETTRRALITEDHCKLAGGLAPDSWTTTIESSTREFNDRATALLGSFLRGRPDADAKTDTSQLDRLELAVAGMERRLHEGVCSPG